MSTTADLTQDAAMIDEELVEKVYRAAAEATERVALMRQLIDKGLGFRKCI